MEVIGFAYNIHTFSDYYPLQKTFEPLPLIEVGIFLVI